MLIPHTSPFDPSLNASSGIDRAKREVQELVDMLKAPGKYGRLGARLPKGILLAGPPGVLRECLSLSSLLGGWWFVVGGGPRVSVLVMSCRVLSI